MTPDQIELVQQSFAKVEPIAGQAADLFYDRLFEMAPSIRPLFADDMTKQKAMLMSVLANAVTNLHRPETIIPTVEALGRRHVGYGAKPEHYELVGASLLWTLQQGLGDDFDQTTREAWAAAYSLLADVMKTAAAGQASTGA